MKTHTTLVNRCPGCGARNSRALGLDDAPLKEGTISICFGCLVIGVFTEGGRIRVLTEDDWRQMSELDRGALCRAVAEVALGKTLTLKRP